MKRLKNFLLSKREQILVFVTALLVFRFLFLLGDLDMAYFGIGLEVLSFLFLVYLTAAFLFFRRKEREEEEKQALLEENERLRMELISREKNLWDYFVLWVHQIKTPVTAIKLILDSEGKERERKVRSQLAYIEQYVDMPMIYLKLMRPDTDMDITACPIDEIIRQAVKKYAQLFIAGHIRLIFEPTGQEVVTDARWLTLLIEQLISNALKYTREGSIEISYRRGVLSVKDTGIGIRSEDIPRIFDKGYSGYNGRMNEKSSGLGLYLADRIAEKLGLRIRVRSEIGKGSEFRVEF